MAEPANVDADRGIYPKYLVFKHPDFMPDSIYADAITMEMSHSVPLELVDDFTFTLRPSKDYHARVALAAYAESVRHWNPHLAEDIWAAMELIQSDNTPRMRPT